MLAGDELKRRIAAARVLRDLSQEDLAAALHADGLGKHDVGRIERGDITMQRVHRDALCRHLGVPERWLTDPDVDMIVGLHDDQVMQAAEVLRLHLLEAGLEVRTARRPGEQGNDGPDLPGEAAGGAR